MTTAELILIGSLLGWFACSYVLVVLMDRVVSRTAARRVRMRRPHAAARQRRRQLAPGRLT